MDRRQPGPIKSVLLVIIIGWLVDWLVGNAVFSETALRIFLIFCMKLGDYKGRKVTESDFWKEFLIWRYREKVSKLAQNRHFDIFLKNGSNDFFGFWPKLSAKYDLQFESNLFFRKTCYLAIFDLKIVKKIAQTEVLGHFLDFASLVFLDSAHNERLAWFLVVFLQFAGLLNVFLFCMEYC